MSKTAEVTDAITNKEDKYRKSIQIEGINTQIRIKRLLRKYDEIKDELLLISNDAYKFMENINKVINFS